MKSTFFSKIRNKITLKFRQPFHEEQNLFQDRTAASQKKF